jgi:hypothetical protein
MLLAILSFVSVPVIFTPAQLKLEIVTSLFVGEVVGEVVSF